MTGAPKDAGLVRAGIEREKWARGGQRKSHGKRERIRLGGRLVGGGERHAVAAVQKRRLPVRVADLEVVLDQISGLEHVTRDRGGEVLVVPAFGLKAERQRLPRRIARLPEHEG